MSLKFYHTVKRNLLFAYIRYEMCFYDMRHKEQSTFLKRLILNESFHEISNDNGIRVVNFAKCKNLIFKSKIFLRHSIYKFTLTFPDGKTK